MGEAGFETGRRSGRKCIAILLANACILRQEVDGVGARDRRAWFGRDRKFRLFLLIVLPSLGGERNAGVLEFGDEFDVLLFVFGAGEAEFGRRVS